MHRMLCDDCGRNKAVVHIVQAGAGGRVEKNLCEECAAKYGDLLMPFGGRDVSVNDFLKGVFGAREEREDRGSRAEQTELVCPNCGMSYADFLQTGKIGCSVCYETFRHQLDPLLRRIHGSSAHSGKIPHRTGGALELKQRAARLREQLRESVMREEYEKAAEYRDAIRRIEKELAAKEGGAAHGDA